MQPEDLNATRHLATLVGSNKVITDYSIDSMSCKSIHNIFSAQCIEKIIEENNLQNVAILGYSKGGVVAKYALLHNNSKNKIKGVIAVACPFSGSRLVRVIPRRSFSELRRKSAIIEELQSDKTSNSRIYSIYPVFDNHVWPQGGSYLDGGHNIEIPVRGHHKILFDREAHEAIIEVTKGIEKEL